MSIQLTGIIVMLFVVVMFMLCSILIGSIMLYVQQQRNNDIIIQFKIHALVADALNARTLATSDIHTYTCGHVCTQEQYIDTDGMCPKCEMDNDLAVDGYLWAEDVPDIDGMFDMSDKTCTV